MVASRVLSEAMGVGRASVVYGVMIVVFAAGLWGVMAVGKRLVAPVDLRGRWAAVGPAGGGWPAVTVEQSGRYFELSFEKGPRFGAAVSEQDERGGLVLGRGPWRVSIGPADGAGTRRFAVEGPQPGVVTGRLERPTTGPAAAAARERSSE